jgi:hypothetical protein
MTSHPCGLPGLHGPPAGPCLGAAAISMSSVQRPAVTVAHIQRFLISPLHCCLTGAVYTYSPYVAPSGTLLDSFSYAWVMIDGPQYSTGPWAQIGPYEGVGGARYTLAQYSTILGWEQYANYWYAAKSIGTTHTYTVLWDEGAGLPYLTFQIDGTTKATPGVTWVPYDGQASGEITSLADQMMGAINVHEKFSNLHIYYSGGWHTYVGSGSAPASYFGRSPTGTITAARYLG